MTVLKLDFDGDPPRDLLDRLWFVGRWLGLGRNGPVVVRPTRRGFHVTTTFTPTLDPVSVVAVQAICGSDFKRETYNLVRARVLDRAPAFWHNRSNVHYARKL